MPRKTTSQGPLRRMRAGQLESELHLGALEPLPRRVLFAMKNGQRCVLDPPDSPRSAGTLPFLITRAMVAVCRAAAFRRSSGHVGG